MGQILTFPAPEAERLDATADRLEHVQWCERETRERRIHAALERKMWARLHADEMRDREAERITNADIWGRVFDGTIPALAAAAFVIGVVIGIIERAL